MFGAVVDRSTTWSSELREKMLSCTGYVGVASTSVLRHWPWGRVYGWNQAGQVGIRVYTKPLGNGNDLIPRDGRI